MCTRVAARALALAVAVFGSGVWLAAAPAAAHATLEATRPAANARLATEPRDVVLTFDEPVGLALGHLAVIGPDGSRIDTGSTSSDSGRAVAIALRPGAGQGAYVVSYRVISADSHPVSGGFFFHVGAGLGPRAATVPTTGSGGSAANAPENPAVDGMFAACRYVGFLGLILLAGGAVFVVGRWPNRMARRRVMRQVWLGYGMVAIATMGELVLQGPYAAGAALTGVTAAGFDDVVGTGYGTAHLVRLALLAVLAPVLASLSGGGDPDGPPDPWAVPLGAAAGIGLVVTWAYSGHPGSTVAAVSVPSDAVHLAASAIWIGGLVVLATALLPLANGSELRTVLPRWSRLAAICVAALVVSGIVQAVIELDAWSELATTAYGQLLLAKIALLGSVLVIAYFARRWVRRAYARTSSPVCRVEDPEPPPADVRRLRQGVVAESVLAAAAVGIAAMLIEAAPGSAAAPHAGAPASLPITRHGAYVAAVRRGDVVIKLKVDPAVAGVQYIYLDATRPYGGRIAVRQWTLAISNPMLGLDQVNVPVLVDTGVGHHFVYGSFTMPSGGAWTVEVTARTSDVDETVVTRTVQVRP